MKIFGSQNKKIPISELDGVWVMRSHIFHDGKNRKMLSWASPDSTQLAIINIGSNSYVIFAPANGVDVRLEEMTFLEERGLKTFDSVNLVNNRRIQYVYELKNEQLKICCSKTGQRPNKIEATAEGCAISIFSKLFTFNNQKGGF